MHLCPFAHYFDQDVGTCESCQLKCGPADLVKDCETWCAGSTTTSAPTLPTAAPLSGNDDITSGSEPHNFYIPVALATCIFIAATTLCVLLAMVVYVRRKKGRHNRDRNATNVTNQQEMTPLAAEGGQATTDKKVSFERQRSSSSSGYSTCHSCQQAIPQSGEPTESVIRKAGDDVNTPDDDNKIPDGDGKVTDEGYQSSRIPSTSSASSSASTTSSTSRKSRDSVDCGTQCDIGQMPQQEDGRPHRPPTTSM